MSNYDESVKSQSSDFGGGLPTPPKVLRTTLNGEFFAFTEPVIVSEWNLNNSYLRLADIPSTMRLSTAKSAVRQNNQFTDMKKVDFFEFHRDSINRAVDGKPTHAIRKDYYGLNRIDKRLSRLYWEDYETWVKTTMEKKGIQGNEFMRNSPIKGRVDFCDLPTVGHQIYILLQYSMLKYTILQGKDTPGDEAKRAAWKRCCKITRFLAGLPESSAPLKNWQGRVPDRSRSHRLISTFQTIDCIIAQILLTAYNGDLSYERIDRVVAVSLDGLLSDEFQVAFCSDETISRMYYVQLKKMRKQLGYALKTFNQEVVSIDFPQRLFWLREIALYIENLGETTEAVQLMNTLAQTRGASTPVRSVAFKSARDWKETVTTPVEPVPKEYHAILVRAIEELYESVDPKPALAKSKIAADLVITMSSCWQELHKNGGKLEASRKIIQEWIGKPLPKYDLETGKPDGTYIVLNSGIEFEKETRFGEFLFHWAYGFALHNPKEVMLMEHITAIEPGKARSVTKAHIAHTILLFPASGIAAEFIALFPSSRGGMKSGNAAWQFFQRLDVFDKASAFLYRGRQQNFDGKMGYSYGPIYGFCTDYVTATDWIWHPVGRTLIFSFLTKIGLPKHYRMLCAKLISSPREVIMTMVDNESTPPVKRLDNFMTTRGIMMGDPLCKVILHLVNLVARQLTRNISLELFQGRVALRRPYRDRENRNMFSALEGED